MLLVALVLLADLPPQRDVPYVVFPALLWAALRFGPRGAATATLIVCSITVWNTAQNSGPFVRESLTDSLLSTQLFIATAAITSLLLAAVTAERIRAARALAQTEAAQHALADEQAALRRVATLVASDAPPSRVFEQVTEEVGRLLALPGANVMHYDGVRTASVVGAWSDEGPPRFPVGAQLDVDGDTVIARVVRTGRAARVDYMEASGTLAETVRSAGYKSAVAAPVTVAGRIWGVLAAASASDDPLPDGIELQLNDFAELVAQALATRTPTRSSPRRARDSWRSATPSGSGSSATCTTARSSASSRWRSGWAWWPRGSRATRRGPGPADHRSGRPRPAGSTSSASWRAASTRRCSRSADSARRSMRWLARAPVPVELTAMPDERLAPPVEAAMYYVVAESITNVAKYAHASGATVSIARSNGAATVIVADDGVGGADPAGGSGLRGLAARVEALNGRLDVASPPGGGTAHHGRDPVGEQLHTDRG